MRRLLELGDSLYRHVCCQHVWNLRLRMERFPGVGGERRSQPHLLRQQHRQPVFQPHLKYFLSYFMLRVRLKSTSDTYCYM